MTGSDVVLVREKCSFIFDRTTSFFFVLFQPNLIISESDSESNVARRMDIKPIVPIRLISFFDESLKYPIFAYIPLFFVIFHALQ